MSDEEYCSQPFYLHSRWKSWKLLFLVQKVLAVLLVGRCRLLCICKNEHAVKLLCAIMCQRLYYLRVDVFHVETGLEVSEKSKPSRSPWVTHRPCIVGMVGPACAAVLVHERSKSCVTDCPAASHCCLSFCAWRGRNFHTFTGLSFHTYDLKESGIVGDELPKNIQILHL